MTFKVGDKVFCEAHHGDGCGDGFSLTGTVVELWDDLYLVKPRFAADAKRHSGRNDGLLYLYADGLLYLYADEMVLYLYADEMVLYLYADQIVLI